MIVRAQKIVSEDLIVSSEPSGDENWKPEMKKEHAGVVGQHCRQKKIDEASYILPNMNGRCTIGTVGIRKPS